MTENERLTMTDEEMDEIRQYAPDFDCPIKAYEGSVTNLFCESVCDEFQNNCPFMEMGKRLKCYEDIGTIEDFKALKEKNEPKEPIKIKTDEKILYMCPSCRKVFIEAYDTVHRGHIPKYCEMCGQNIKWSWGQ